MLVRPLRRRIGKRRRAAHLRACLNQRQGEMRSNMGHIRGLTYDSAQGPTRISCPILLTGEQHCAPVRHGGPDYVWVVYTDVVHECGPYELGYDQQGRGGDGLSILARWDLDGLIGEVGLYHYCDGYKLFGPYHRSLLGWFGGLAYEFAHAFGLPHPPWCDPWDPETFDGNESWSLMHDGYQIYPETYLFPSNKEILMPSLFFERQ